MKTPDEIRDRLRELHEEGDRLKVGNEDGLCHNEQHNHSCRGWLTAVQSLMCLILGNSSHPYRSNIDLICSNRKGYYILTQVGEITAILERLIFDLDNDLLFSIEDRVRATVFEEFLEEAKRYVKAKKLREASIFGAAVFEDTLRSLSRACGIEEEGVRSDKLISDLANKGVLSPVKAKRARASADVRNKAMHAQWDDIDIGDVNTLISLTEELISRLDENRTS